jgi:DNA-binding PadR family transcriptional regulator
VPTRSRWAKSQFSWWAARVERRRIADRLEKDGLIVRETQRENRRIVRVQLTDQGRKVLRKADQTFRTTLQENFSDHLGDNEVVELRRALRHLLEKNGAWQEARCDLTLAKPS